MNYGYDSNCKGWNPLKVKELVLALQNVIKKYRPEESYENYTPYIEVDGMYDGIRIRRITHIPNYREMVREADDVYRQVMG